MGVAGPKKNPVLKWSFTAPSTPLRGISIGTDNTVYFSTSSGGTTFYALTNGPIGTNAAVKWSYTPSGQGSTPAIGPNGIIYLGSENRDLYALTNGAVKWSYTTGGWIYSSPIVGPNGVIYVGSSDNSLYAVTNGGVKWSYNTGGEIRAVPCLGSGNTVYVGSYSGTFYAITNGAVKWSYAAGVQIDSSALVGPDNTVYFADRSGNVRAMTNGSVKWSCSVGSWCYGSPCLGPDNTLYITTWGAGNNKLHAITNGGEKWSYTASDSIYSSPTVDRDNFVYFGSRDGNFYAVSNGVLKWSFNPGGDVDTSAAIGPDGTIYFGSLNNRMLAVKQDETPQLSWSGAPGFISDGVDPGTNSSGSLFTFRVIYSDAENGLPATNQLWLDRNGDGTYQPGEKFVMNQSDTNDSATLDGKEYFLTNRVSLAPGSAARYRFYFTDSYYPAAGAPAGDHYFFIASTNQEVQESVYPDLEKASIAPNPFTPGANRDSLVFFYLTPEFEARIFSLGGAEAAFIRGRSVNGQYRWLPADSNGRPLKPGVYFCLLSSPAGQKKELKIVIRK